MESGDLGAVLRIISAHDKDDFEAAREELRDDFGGMFILPSGARSLLSPALSYARTRPGQ
jgi:hypothetical protein